MSNLVPIEHDSQRVLTTHQLAEGYETESIKIQQNFSNNRDRYIQGIHYFILEGDALRRFKGELENFEVAPNVNRIFLWTEKGSLLHAKSLNTDKAWEVYQQLVDTYFRVTEKQLNIPAQIDSKLLFQIAAQLEEKEKQIALMAPKAQSYDVLMDATGCMTINEVAKMLDIKGIGQNKMFELLRLENIIYKKGDCYLPYERYRSHFIVKQNPIKRGDMVFERSQLFVSTKGLDWLAHKLMNMGYQVNYYKGKSA